MKQMTESLNRSCVLLSQRYLFMLLVLLSALPLITTAATPATLVTETHLPLNSISYKSLTQLQKKLARETTNKVKLSLSPHNKFNDLFRHVKNGEADLALVPISTIPGLEISRFPYAISGNTQIRTALYSRWTELRFNETNFLDSWYFGNYYILSKKQLNDVKSIQGLSILATGKAGKTFARGIGAEVVPLPIAQLYKAFSGWTERADAFQVFSRNIPAGKILLPTNHLVMSNLLLANHKTISKLTRDQYAKLIRLSREVGHAHDLIIYKKESQQLAPFKHNTNSALILALRKKFFKALGDEYSNLKRKGGFILASGDNGCPKNTECKCKTGDAICRCSTKCKENINCK